MTTPTARRAATPRTACQLLILLSVAVAPRSARALDLYVNTTIDQTDIDVADGICDSSFSLGYQCTLRAAAQEARFSAGPDTIHLAAGTYTLTILGDDNGSSAAGDLDFLGDVTLLGPAGGRAKIAGGLFWGETLLDFASSTGSQLRIERLELTGGGGSQGGALKKGDSNLTIVDSWLHDNSSSGPGGAIYSGGGTLTIERTTIDSNEAGLDGGGIADYNATEVTITDSTIALNTSGRHGAGIFSSDTMHLTNVTLSGNRADGGGGAIFQFDDSTWAELRNVTVYDNRADFDEDLSIDSWGGGILARGAVFLSNSIVAGNSSDVVWNNEGSNDCFVLGPNSQFQSLGYLFLGELCGGYDYVAGTGDVVGQDPELGPLQVNGGPTPTHRPLPGSPAIDGASPLLPPAGGACAVADQRGVERPQDGDESGLVTCDFGAVEYDPPLFADGFESGDRDAWSFSS